MEKIIHQIWVGDFKIPIREQKLSAALKEMHSDYEYMLWRKPPELPANVQYWYDSFYLDIDFDIQKRLDAIYEHDGILFYHNDFDFTIPNNLIGAKKGAEHLKFCIDEINPACSWYGPSWLGTTIKKYLNLPYETVQAPVMQALNSRGIFYHEYWAFEKEYGKHLSLYSWEPKTWERLRKDEQL